MAKIKEKIYGNRDREWLTVAEAADYLRVSRDTIYRWAKQGKLTLYKLGGLTRLKQRELDSLAVPKAKVDPWTVLSEEAFSDWDNPEDAVYDHWEELYGLSEG
jgi:excisionase family DNA binding protein